MSAYGLANLFYLLFASGEVQPWNTPGEYTLVSFEVEAFFRVHKKFKTHH